MPWWGWVTLGILLLGAELVGVDAAFYLMFVGAAAICIGILGLGGMDLPIWGQYLAFAALAITSNPWSGSASTVSGRPSCPRSNRPSMRTN